MSFLEEFVGGTANLPGDLQQNYSLIRQLDEQQRELQKQMQEYCMQGLDDVRDVLTKGTSPSADVLASRYCSNILSVHKTCVEVANEKVELAVSTYDMVDNYIQRLDKYLKKCKDEYVAVKESQDDTAMDTGGSTGGQDQQQSNADIDLPVDPNEPTYCYCNQVSFGEMIACDNPDCKIEWFHFDCVGIKERPKGKWYCTDCSSLMKRRRVR